MLGFLGMLALSPLMRQSFNVPTGLTAFTGALLLACMAVPTIIVWLKMRWTRCPRAYRDAALALGATKWQTIWRVTLPAGRSGVLTAMMLGIGRAIGETMTVMMVTGNAARLPLTLDRLMHPVRTMTATIAAEMGEVANGSTHYHVLFAMVGIALFVITFASQPGRVAGDFPADAPVGTAVVITMSRQLSNVSALHLLPLSRRSSVPPIVVIVGYMRVARRAGALLGVFSRPCRTRACAQAAFGRRLSARRHLTLGTGLIAVPLALARHLISPNTPKTTPFTRHIRLAIVKSGAGIPSVVMGCLGWACLCFSCALVC